MQNKIHCRFIVVLISSFVTLFAASSTADDQEALSRAMTTAEHLQRLTDSSDGTMPLYYDYLENGTLTGGKLTIPIPAPAIETLSNESYTSYTYIDNGPVANRINLVCVGDGYTAGEMDLFWQHVENVISNFFVQSPLSQYASYFNVHVVEVISNQSGVDEPDKGIYRDTALNMAFNCGGIARLLCVDYSKAWTAASNAPAVDLVIAIANSSRYGGAGYSSLSTLSGGNSSSVEVALHEFGHSFARLADEYHYSDGTTYTGSERPEANVSIYNAAQQTAGSYKWYRWLDQAQVNTFEGAYYKQYGIFRPTNTSKMKSLGYPFGPVNSEQFVLSIYDTVSPIDQTTPSTTVIQSAGDLFTVICQTPSPDSLAFTWKIDGVPVSSAGEPAFCPLDDTLPNTVQTLSVDVIDRTQLVRDESGRNSIMTDSRSWQIWRASADFNLDGNVNLLDISLMAPSWLSNDPQFDIVGPGGDGIVNLKDLAVLSEQWSSPEP